MITQPPRTSLFPYTTLFRSTLFVCNGTQNAVAVVSFRPGKSRLLGLVPTGAAWIFPAETDRKSTRLNSSHRCISYAVFCLKKKMKKEEQQDKIITMNDISKE